MCRCRDMEAGLLMLLSSRVGDDELLLHTAQCIGQARMGGGGFRRAPGRDDVAPYLWRKRRRGTYRLMSDSPHRTRSCGGWSSSKTGSELVKGDLYYLSLQGYCHSGRNWLWLNGANTSVSSWS
ncbi:uncharacterized protein LOC124697427 [Lolium rigidum]|uniref:uncharacterized protein LOC124697427 n=1 Tax=Lolium rigidum TaxID=89674 RepID=UPI001F5D481C|nr:uncharacterized protein LOC124697427 [Lolium rigidum]